MLAPLDSTSWGWELTVSTLPKQAVWERKRCKRQPETVFSSSCGFRVRLTNVGSDAPQLKKFDRACVKLRVPFGPPRT